MKSVQESREQAIEGTRSHVGAKKDCVSSKIFVSLVVAPYQVRASFHEIVNTAIVQLPESNSIPGTNPASNTPIRKRQATNPAVVFVNPCPKVTIPSLDQQMRELTKLRSKY